MLQSKHLTGGNERKRKRREQKGGDREKERKKDGDEERDRDRVERKSYAAQVYADQRNL